MNDRDSSTISTLDTHSSITPTSLSSGSITEGEEDYYHDDDDTEAKSTIRNSARNGKQIMELIKAFKQKERENPFGLFYAFAQSPDMMRLMVRIEALATNVANEARWIENHDKKQRRELSILKKKLLHEHEQLVKLQAATHAANQVYAAQGHKNSWRWNPFRRRQGGAGAEEDQRQLGIVPVTERSILDTSDRPAVIHQTITNNKHTREQYGGYEIGDVNITPQVALKSGMLRQVPHGPVDVQKTKKMKEKGKGKGGRG